MFDTNDAAHEERVKLLARSLAESPDQDWKKKVDGRYAAYLRVLADEAEAGLLAAEERGLPDTERAHEYARYPRGHRRAPRVHSRPGDRRHQRERPGALRGAVPHLRGQPRYYSNDEGTQVSTHETINRMVVSLEVPLSAERAHVVSLLQEALCRGSAIALVELNKIVKDVRST